MAEQTEHIEQREQTTRPKEGSKTLVPIMPELKKPIVIYVLGPPGAGKGTLCKKIQQKYDIKHISIGDWLRAEVAKQTDTGNLVKIYVKRGDLVPDQIIKNILSEEFFAPKPINEVCPALLIDGFPRKVTQIPDFDEIEPAIVLFFDCQGHVARNRVLTRIDGSRTRDTSDVFARRYAEFEKENPAVLDHFVKAGKEVVKIDTSGDTKKSWNGLTEQLDRSTAWKEMLAKLEADFETVVSYDSPTAEAETQVEMRPWFG
ncbi:adenylate kinase-domain-containing protein [Exophiala viscosa]|uniref:Adenylate kinase-domain-containing protein n=1 Tax=Exophiala viscosa TaxID=2486360 RepID=A0AAN6DR64_9EURO|nr:adenylate kinase-domain-containing protein [Exophiala viscosa]